VAGGLVCFEDDGDGCAGLYEAVWWDGGVCAGGVVLRGGLGRWCVSLGGGVEGGAAGVWAASTSAATTAAICATASKVAAATIGAATSVGAAGCGEHGFEMCDVYGC
jgi:hypothetical protein